MRFIASVLVAGAFAAGALAQDATLTSSAPPAATSLTDGQVECLLNCDDSDVSCRAACVPVRVCNWKLGGRAIGCYKRITG
jgi:hypothetical protein